MREVCAGPFLKKTYENKGLLCAGALLHYEKYNFCYQSLKNDYAQYEFKIVMASTPNKPTKILITPRAFQGFASAFLQLRRRKLFPSLKNTTQISNGSLSQIPTSMAISFIFGACVLHGGVGLHGLCPSRACADRFLFGPLFSKTVFFTAACGSICGPSVCAKYARKYARSMRDK